MTGERAPWLNRWDREVLVAVLVYHQRSSDSGCSCGWAVLGASFAEHVADVYEFVLVTSADPSEFPS